MTDTRNTYQVLRYELALGRTVLALNVQHTLLRAAVKPGDSTVSIWIAVEDPGDGPTRRAFYTFATGEQLEHPEQKGYLEYVDTCVTPEGLVWHVYADEFYTDPDEEEPGYLLKALKDACSDIATRADELVRGAELTEDRVNQSLWWLRHAEQKIRRAFVDKQNETTGLQGERAWVRCEVCRAETLGHPKQACRVEGCIGTTQRVLE